MNRFFRSAFFPLLVIVALAWLASETLRGNDTKQRDVTYSQVQDQVLDLGRCASRGPRDRWLILPADAVQSLPPCVLDPVVGRGLRDAEAAGDLALGQAASDGLDDLTTALSGQALLLMVTSWRNAVSIKVTSWYAFRRSAEARRRTNVDDRQVVAAT